MKLVRIKNSGHEKFPEATALYAASFPLHERREDESQRAVLDDEEYHFNLLFEGETFLGLLLCWETERFIYVEHFCILPEMRGKDYGGRALALLSKMGRSVILEIDPPEDDISIRVCTDHIKSAMFMIADGVIPSYRRGFDGHRLVVMSSPAPLSDDGYKDFFRYLCERVMKNEPR